MAVCSGRRSTRLLDEIGLFADQLLLGVRWCLRGTVSTVQRCSMGICLSLVGYRFQRKTTSFFMCALPQWNTRGNRAWMAYCETRAQIVAARGCAPRPIGNSARPISREEVGSSKSHIAISGTLSESPPRSLHASFLVAQG